MKYCTQCSSPNDDKARFCGGCGVALKTTTAGGLAPPITQRTLVDQSPPRPPTTAGFGGTLVDADAGCAGVPALGLAGNKQQYEVLEEIGRGGMSVVYRARDRKLHREVALKRLLPQFTQRERAVARLMTEARSIANLQHPNIVSVFDIDQDEDGPYIAMEFVAGRNGKPQTLEEKIKQDGVLNERAALALMRKLCDAVALAHGKNIVHRDIKPSNILLTADGTPKLLDFGIAQAAGETVGQTLAGLTMEGSTLGTLAYMAPEQRRNAKGVNHTADIYALGKTLYELLTGESPENVDPELVSPAVGRVILKCIKTKPEERYSSVDDFWRDLEQAVRVAAPAPTPATSVPAGNQCPSCRAVNEPDAKFCDGCGSGLTRHCPECEQENSVNRPFCRGCGTDVPGFLALQELVGKMEKFTTERKWSQVLKEAEAGSGSVKLPGKKGKQLQQKRQTLQTEAQRKAQRLAELAVAVGKALEKQDLRGAAEMLRELQELDPNPEQVDVRLREVAQRIEDHDYEEVLVATGAAERARQWTKAIVAIRSFLLQHGNSQRAGELRERLAGVEQQDAREQAAEILSKAKTSLALCNLAAALEQAEKALELCSASPQAVAFRKNVLDQISRRDKLATVAAMAEQDGQLQAALETWQEVRALDLHHTAANEGIARIEKQLAALRATQRRRNLAATCFLALIGLGVVGVYALRHLTASGLLGQAEGHVSKGDLTAANAVLEQVKPVPWQKSRLASIRTQIAKQTEAYATLGATTEVRRVAGEQSNSSAEVAVIKTSEGDMVFEFWPDVAPNHVENFKKLAKKGFYDGTCFHRIIKGFMIQGGDPLTKDEANQSHWGTGGPGFKIKAEFNDKPHVRGVLSMARSQDPDSAGSQFFICHGDPRFLDKQYTVFGKLTKGDDVLEKIATTPTQPGDRPVKRMHVDSIKIVAP